MKNLKLIPIAIIGVLLILSISPGLSPVSGTNDDIFVEPPSIEYGNGIVVIKGTLANYNSSSTLLVEICTHSGDSKIKSYASTDDGSIYERFRTGYLTKGDYLIKFTYATLLHQSICENIQFTVENETEEIPVTGVILDKTELTLAVGENQRLNADIEPATASNPGVFWNSSNPSVAKVDNTGLVTAQSPGTAVITVTTEDGGKIATCNVTVSGSTTVSITLSDSTKSIYNNGEGSRLSANLLGVSASYLTWISNDPDIVQFLVGTSFKDTISGISSVTIIGLATGKTTITVTSPNASATCEVTVSEKPADLNKEWYYFYICFKEDSEAADGTKFAADAEKGFWLAGYGANAAEALENACNENGIQIMLITKGALKGWLGTFFGLGDVQLSGGMWKYWSQYKWTGPDFSSGGSWSYNNSSLGWYDQGGTFALVRQTTSVDGASANIGVAASDVPLELRHDTDVITVTYNTNGGSAENFTEKVKKGVAVDLSKSAGTREGYEFKGWAKSSGALTALSSLTAGDQDLTLYAVWISESAEVTVTNNPDGSQTVTIVDEKQNEDGTVMAVTESTTTKENEDGSKQVTVAKTETVKDGDGNTKSSLEEKSKETIAADGSFTKQTDTIVKDAEGNSLEETTSLAIDDKTSGVVTSTEIKKDAAGVTSSSTSKVSVETTEGKLSVDSAVIDAALQQAEEAKKLAAEKEVEIAHTLEIESTGNASAEATTAELLNDSLSKLAEADISVKLKTEVAEIELPPEVTKNLVAQGGEKVSVTLAKADVRSLNEKQQAAVGDALVFDFAIKSETTDIHELGGNIRITVPYELKEGEDPAKITVWYVDDLGNIVKKDSVYDAETKTISFTTNHLSFYFVKEDLSIEPTPEPVPNGGNNNTLYYAAAIIAVLAILAVLYIVLRKKNKL